MNRVDVAWAYASDTTEIVLPRFARALTDAPTQEIPMPYCKPDLTRPRWSWLARTLAALVVVNAAGLTYVAVTL